MTTLTAEQGSQPTVDDLQIGIIDAATHDGVAKAYVLLRLATGDEPVVITSGESIDVAGHGRLEVSNIEFPPEGRALVTLSLT